MNNLPTVDLNKFGYFFWLILLGFTTLISSIVFNDRYVELGILITIYGMVAFMLDLVIDRVLATRVNLDTSSAETIKESMKKVPVWVHLLRFFLQLFILVFFILEIESKYYIFSS